MNHKLASIKIPVKTPKTSKELKEIEEVFRSRANETVVRQFESKKKFHEKVKFLRFMGYVE